MNLRSLERKIITLGAAALLLAACAKSNLPTNLPNCWAPNQNEKNNVALHQGNVQAGMLATLATVENNNPVPVVLRVSDDRGVFGFVLDPNRVGVINASIVNPNQVELTSVCATKKDAEERLKWDKLNPLP